MINYSRYGKTLKSRVGYMTLKTIAGYRNTDEAKAVESQIEFRAGGASIFANEQTGPRVSSPSAPSL